MKKLTMISGIMLFVFTHLFAQKSEVFISSGAAIRGYDAVAYFKQGKPVKGNKDFSVSWKDATWYFSSRENLDAFKADPEKYAPQYGGYCAYGLSEGHKATTEPDAWTIIDGKLYLNYNKEVKTLWSKDRENNIQKADKNWPQLKDKE